jgi:hypothetical protein
MQKKWMQHRDLLFTTMPLTGLGSGPQLMDHLWQLPTKHLRDNWTCKEKMAMLEWVRLFSLSLFKSDSC